MESIDCLLKVVYEDTNLVKVSHSISNLTSFFANTYLYSYKYYLQ
jgi:hypothetical protein